MKQFQNAKLTASITPFVTLLLTASSAFAGSVGNIPEPGILSLFGLGGVVLAAVAIRNRRNKK